MNLPVPMLGQFPVLFDLGLYFLVFGAAARAAFSRSFPGREGRVLAVGVGLALAVSLTFAQKKLGFSLAKLGPAAVFVLCLLIFAASFKFLHHARIPLPVALLLSALLALILVHATLPGLTNKVGGAYPLGIAAALVAALAFAVIGSEHSAARARRRRPGTQLARQKIIPSDEDLGREIKVIKNRVRRPTEENRKDEKKVDEETEQIQKTLKKDGQDLKPHQSEIELMDDILKRAELVRDRSKRLCQLDYALQNFDLKWLKAAHRINLDDLTPALQMVLRKTIQDERKALKVEQRLDELETGAERYSKAVEAAVSKAKQTLQSGNLPGAAGWMKRAQDLDRKLLQIDTQALAWERRLLKLVRRQRKELDQLP
jgi:hypothetical protein